MRSLIADRVLLRTVLLIGVLLKTISGQAADEVSFQRDIQPILADRSSPVTDRMIQDAKRNCGSTRGTARSHPATGEPRSRRESRNPYESFAFG